MSSSRKAGSRRCSSQIAPRSDARRAKAAVERANSGHSRIGLCQPWAAAIASSSATPTGASSPASACWSCSAVTVGRSSGAVPWSTVADCCLSLLSTSTDQLLCLAGHKGPAPDGPRPGTAALIWLVATYLVTPQTQLGPFRQRRQMDREAPTRRSVCDSHLERVTVGGRQSRDRGYVSQPVELVALLGIRRTDRGLPHLEQVLVPGRGRAPPGEHVRDPDCVAACPPLLPGPSHPNRDVAVALDEAFDCAAPRSRSRAHTATAGLLAAQGSPRPSRHLQCVDEIHGFFVTGRGHRRCLRYAAWPAGPRARVTSAGALSICGGVARGCCSYQRA